MTNNYPDKLAKLAKLDMRDTIFGCFFQHLVSLSILFLNLLASYVSFIYEMLRFANRGRIGGLASYGRSVLLSECNFLGEKYYLVIVWK